MRFYVIFFYSSIIFAQPLQSGWQKNVMISHEGINRYFDVYIPSLLVEEPPLVIQLHGGTQSKDEIYNKNAGASKYWKDCADTNSFLLIVPNGTNLETGLSKGNTLNWNDCRLPKPNEKQADDVGFISKIIDWSIPNYQINSKKVYVTGISNGGFMAYRLALELPNKITAIAAFAANYPKDSECNPSGIPLPVMIVNGTKDQFIPFEGGITKFKSEQILSSQETVNFWLKNNNIAFRKPQISMVSDNFKRDNSTISIFDFAADNPNRKVRYCIVQGGGHTMPGKKYGLKKIIQKIVGNQNQDLEGAELAWDFFKDISK